MSEEEQRIEETKKCKNNVHYWLRAVFLFVFLTPDDTKYKVADADEKRQSGEELKGPSEVELRRYLNLDSVIISREEALQACKELFHMFLEPFDDAVQGFINDPRCPGGKPRGAANGH